MKAVIYMRIGNPEQAEAVTGKIRGNSMSGICADNGVPGLQEFLQKARAYDRGFAYHMGRLARSAPDAVSLTSQRKDLRTIPYMVYGKCQRSRGK